MPMAHWSDHSKAFGLSTFSPDGFLIQTSENIKIPLPIHRLTPLNPTLSWNSVDIAQLLQEFALAQQIWCCLLPDNVSCSDSLCLNRGKCLSGTDSSHNCSCHGGYGGVNCSDDLDMCGHLAPCLNGATCINAGPNAYICQCTHNYNGSNCDIPTGEDSKAMYTTNTQ